MTPSDANLCGAEAVFWPEAEACEAKCIKRKGHSGEHQDEILGKWSDDELPTRYPDDDE